MKFIWDNCKLYFDGRDLSADLNQMELSADSEIKDATVYGSAGRRKLAGLMNVQGQFTGLYEAGSEKVDPVIWSRFAVDDKVMMVCPTDGSDGEIAYSAEGAAAQYSPLGSVGDIAAFGLTIEGSGKLIRGTIMAAGVKTATGSGSIRQLGAVSAGQKLYLIVQVLAASVGDTLDITLNSDNLGAFGSPTLRVTVPQQTAQGAVFMTPVDGPITDDWWRVTWTIGGVDPSFTIAVAVGIQ